MAYTNYGYELYTILPANLTGVTLTPTPFSPQVAGTPITLTVAAQGGITYPNVQYQIWSEYELANGTWSPTTLVSDWSTGTTCVWTPSTQNVYNLIVYARPVGSTAAYVVTTSYIYTVSPANLTGVTLSANLPSPQNVGTTINLTATPQGGISYPNVEYQFVAQYKLANGSWAPNILVRDWSTDPQCIWVASAPENYYVNVYARPVGSTVPYAATTYILYAIVPANLTGVTLSANPQAPQLTGASITFTATALGGIAYPNAQYQFVAQYKLANGSWAPNVLMQDWSTSNTCLWAPTMAENYYVNVYVRPVGDTAPYVVTTYIAYNILPANLTGVTLTANLASSQVTGTAITFTATALGGITAPNVQYQFVAQYKNADGTWAPNVLLQDWSSSNTCTWTPTAAENYYVNVYVRPVGDTAPYVVTTYITYTILPANLTGVTLAANPASSQKTGTNVTFTATPQGGITAPSVQYQFVAQYKLANGSWAPNILMQDWSTSNTCTWTPSTAQKYYINVYVRPVGDNAPYVVTTYIVYTFN